VRDGLRVGSSPAPEAVASAQSEIRKVKMLAFDALTQLEVNKAWLHLILIIMGYELAGGLSNDLISIWCKRAQQTSRSQVFSPGEDAFDEIAATLLNLARQLCRAFLFRTPLARSKSSPAGAQPSSL
jgi:hypothetical protein